MSEVDEAPRVVEPSEEAMVLLAMLEETRDKIEELTATARNISRRLDAILGDAVVTWGEGTAKVIRPSPAVRVDLGALKAIDPDLYGMVTTPKLDAKKLRRAFRARQVSRAAAGLMSTEPRSAYVRFDVAGTEEKERDDDD